MVLSAKGDMLAWNAPAAALLGDWSRFPPAQRNIIWQRFFGTSGRVAMTEDEREATAAQSIASLRAAAARYPDDQAWPDCSATCGVAPSSSGCGTTAGSLRGGVTARRSTIRRSDGSRWTAKPSTCPTPIRQ